jgi:hypothetical protein
MLQQHLGADDQRTPKGTVSTPDGSTFAFPDGTPTDTIRGAIDRHRVAAGRVHDPRAPGLVSGIGRAAARGVPIIGSLLNKADAVTDGRSRTRLARRL